MIKPEKIKPCHHDSIRNAPAEKRVTLWLEKAKNQVKKTEKKTGKTFTFDAERIAKETNLDTRRVGMLLRRFGGIDKQSPNPSGHRANYVFTNEPISPNKYDMTKPEC